MKALSMEQNDKYFNKTKQALLELEDVLEDLKIVAKGAVNKNNELSLRVSRLNNEIEQKISDIEEHRNKLISEFSDYTEIINITYERVIFCTKYNVKDDIALVKKLLSFMEKQIILQMENGSVELELTPEQITLFVGFGDLYQHCQELYKYIFRIRKYQLLYNDKNKIEAMVKEYYPGKNSQGISLSSLEDIRKILERVDFFGAFFDFCVEKYLFMSEQKIDNDLELLGKTLTVISDTSSHEESDIDFISKLVGYSGIDNTFMLGTNNKNEASNYGKMGESVVNYYLKWFCGKNHYVMINKGKPARLYNKDFINESQEIDHIIVGEKGIFLIETKNFKGRVSLAKSGVLLQEKKNSESMKIDIGFQIERHHSLIESIVGNDVPIIDILCFAHPECTIEDNKCEDFVTLPIAELRSFLSDYQGNSVLSENEVKEYVSVLESHIVD